jgi:hypothetical protein
MANKNESIKRLLRPIIKEILLEYQSKPTKVPDLEGVLKKYGIMDILATAKDYYKTKNERGSAMITQQLIDKYESLLDYTNAHLKQ